MKAVRHSVVAMALLVVGIGSSGTASAGIPVIDAANLAQAIQQVVSWGQQQLQMVTQISNQVNQITNQVTQIERISGTRNLGQIFNSPLLQQVVPSNVSSVMSSIGSQGFNGLTTAAQALRTASAIYNCAEKPTATAIIQCQAGLSLNSQRQSWTNDGLGVVTSRVTEIQNMQQQINGTTDPKGIEEVTAALQAETAQVANDQNRIALMQLQMAAQQQAIAQAAQERERTMQVADAPSISDNVVFP